MSIRFVSLLGEGFALSISTANAATDFRQIYEEHQGEITEALDYAETLELDWNALPKGRKISRDECKEIYRNAAAISGDPWKLIPIRWETSSFFCGHSKQWVMDFNGVTPTGQSFDRIITESPNDMKMLLNSRLGLVVGYTGAGLELSSPDGRTYWSVGPVKGCYPMCSSLGYWRADRTLSADERYDVHRFTSLLRVRKVDGSQTHEVYRKLEEGIEECLVGVTLVGGKEVEYFPDKKSFKSCKRLGWW